MPQLARLREQYYRPVGLDRRDKPIIPSPDATLFRPFSRALTTGVLRVVGDSGGGRRTPGGIARGCGARAKALPQRNATQSGLPQLCAASIGLAEGLDHFLGVGADLGFYV